MDARAHKRFLEYQDLWSVFGRGENRKKLDRESWEALDAEHAALVARAATGGLGDEEHARLARLRRALLRD